MSTLGERLSTTGWSTLNALVLVVLVVNVQLTGCTSAPPAGMLERAPGAASVSSRQLGVLTTDYASVFADTVKASADQIGAQAADLPARRAALLWKIKAVPAVYTAAAHEDPLFGLADLWVLAIQQRDLLARDETGEILGEGQEVALDAATDLLERVEAMARQTLRDPEVFSEIETFVREFAREHPIRDFSFVRESVAPLYVEFVQEQSDLVQQVALVGDYAGTALALALVGLNHAPEIARWQVELTLLDAETYPVVDRTVKSVDALGIAATQLTQVAADLPLDIDAQRDAILRDLERQRIETLRDIEAMRRAAFADIAREREVVFTNLDLRLTRVLESVRMERETLTAQVPLVAEQAGAAVMPLTREVIDHAFWRALQLLLVLFVLLVVSAFVLRWKRKGDAPVAGTK